MDQASDSSTEPCQKKEIETDMHSGTWGRPTLQIALILVLANQIDSRATNIDKVEKTFVATTPRAPSTEYPLTRYERGLEDYDEEQENINKARGMDSDEMMIMMATTKMPEEMKESRKADSWSGGYYDFLINEGSYKFWAAFQLATAALLIYSAFAAIYYSKFNLIAADYDYDYYGSRRSIDDPVSIRNSPWLGLTSEKFQAILNAVFSKKYS